MTLYTPAFHLTIIFLYSLYMPTLSSLLTSSLMTLVYSKRRKDFVRHFASMLRTAIKSCFMEKAGGRENCQGQNGYLQLDLARGNSCMPLKMTRKDVDGKGRGDKGRECERHTHAHAQIQTDRQTNRSRKRQTFIETES